MADLKERSKINAYVDHENMSFRVPIKLAMAKFKENPGSFKKDGFRSEAVEDSYSKIAESFVKLIEILDRNPGPFVMGPNLSLADFAYFFTVFEAVTKLRAEYDKYQEVQNWYEKVLKYVQGLEGMADVLEKYAQSSD